MKKCGQCIHWEQASPYYTWGTCIAPLPVWVLLIQKFVIPQMNRPKSAIVLRRKRNMSHPQYDAEQLISEHGLKDALLHAKDLVNSRGITTPEYFHALAIWCYIKGYLEGQKVL